MDFTWLHISDLHCRPRSTTDRLDSWRRLLELTNDRRQTFPQVDAVFFTGDLAHGGKRAEYEHARELLDELTSSTRVPPSRVFIVPGNHDVDHDVIQPYHMLSIGGLVKPTGPYHVAIDSIFEHPATVELLDQKLDGFRKGMGIAHTAWRGGRQPALVTILKHGEGVRSLRIGVVGLNSARLVSGDKRPDADRNRLLVGRGVLHAALERLRNMAADIVFVFSHHPVEWLHNDEGPEIDRILLERVDIAMFGHLHHARVRVSLSPGSQTLHLHAGALYDDSNYRQAVTFGRWDTSTGKIEIRAFSKPGPGASYRPEPDAFAPSQASGRCVYKGFPKTEPNQRASISAGQVQLKMIDSLGGLDNKAGFGVGVFLETDQPTMSAIRQVRYTLTVVDRDPVVGTSNDRDSRFFQTFRTGSGPGIGHVRVEAAVVFADFSERSLGPITLGSS